MNSCHEEGVRDRNRAGIEAADPALQFLIFQLDSGREHPPRDMSSSETGYCYGRIDDKPIGWPGYAHTLAKHMGANDLWNTARLLDRQKPWTCPGHNQKVLGYP
eukprot:gene12353-biopygen288